jgi:DHA1 family inner membrane transport protein
VANAIGAWAGGHTIAQGLGLLSAVWAGFALTLAGLVLFLVVRRRPAEGRRAGELYPL